MNIRELLNKLRGSKDINNSLILPANLETIPMRDKLDSDKIQRLDEIKKKYEDILSQNDKGYFYSYNLTSKFANDEMKMYFSLFGRIVFNHETDDIGLFSNRPLYKMVNLYVHRYVNSIKIKLYIDAMEKIYTDTHLKLVALKEIYDESVVRNEGVRLNKGKKEALVNEIYNLTTNYVIYKSDVYSALLEVKTYESEIYNDNSESIHELVEMIKKYDLIENDFRKRLIDLAKDFIPNELGKILAMKLDFNNEIALIEKELEIYTYENIKVDTLNDELENIDNIPKTLATKDNLLKVIAELEKKYILASDYGRYELDLNPLYEVKFDILTTDIVKQKNSPFENVSERELSFYKDIIASRIETNITGVDSLLSQWIDDKKIVSSAISVVRGDNFFDFGAILSNRLLLSFILSMESREKAQYFFDNYMLDFTNLKDKEVVNEKPFPLTNFSFTESSLVPFSTLCHIYGLYYDKTEKNRFRNYAYWMIYNYLMGEKEEFVYKIPVGIEEIKFCEVEVKPKDIDGTLDTYFLYDNIRKAINNKNLVAPSTLKKIDIRGMDITRLNIPYVVLNEGLVELKCYSYYISHNIQSLTIPSTLEKVSVNRSPDNDIERYSALYYIPELTFTNFKESIILNNSESRKKMLQIKCRAAINNIFSSMAPDSLVFDIFPVGNSILLVSDGRGIKIDIKNIVGDYFYESYYNIFHDQVWKNLLRHSLEEGHTIYRLKEDTIAYATRKCDIMIIEAMSSKYEKLMGNNRGCR